MAMPVDHAALRLRRRYDDAGVASADLVVEAAFERLAVKKEIFGRLDAACKPSAILATNTSTLDIDEIAAATSRPASVCGTHFFSPANVMPLLENVAGKETSPQVIASVMGMGKKLGKKAVLARYSSFAAAFAEIDKDGSGTLRRAELRRFLRQMVKTIPDRVITGLIDFCDDDGDSKSLSKDEFVKLMSAEYLGAGGFNPNAGNRK